MRLGRVSPAVVTHSSSQCFPSLLVFLCLVVPRLCPAVIVAAGSWGDGRRDVRSRSHLFPGIGCHDNNGLECGPSRTTASSISRVPLSPWCAWSATRRIVGAGWQQSMASAPSPSQAALAARRDRPHHRSVAGHRGEPCVRDLVKSPWGWPRPARSRTGGPRLGISPANEQEVSGAPRPSRDGHNGVDRGPSRTGRVHRVAVFE
jgi:hypothetical protein